MKVRTLCTYVFFLSLFGDHTSVAFAQETKRISRPATRVKPCAAQIDEILRDTIFNNAFVGIKTVSLKTGKVIYRLNENKLFRPASNGKLFTTAAALALLGGDFQFRTEVLADSAIINGILRGSVYVKGYGDPLLSTGDLDSLAQTLQRQGIKQILGDIVGDVSYFDDIFWGKGWMWDDDPGAIWPYLTPLSVNGNSILVNVAAGSLEGDTLWVSLQPQTSFVTVANHGTTSSDPLKPPLNVSRLWKERQNVISVEGAMRPYTSSSFRFNVWRPEYYTLALFKERLAGRNIVVRGATRIGTAPQSALLASVAHSLDTVVTVVNKDSYNLGAELLLKTLAAEFKGLPGRADSGTVVIEEFLATLGIDTAAVVLVDGSGVSRYNLVSPRAIVQLLTEQHHHPAQFETFYRTLPIAGADGTLKTRMTNGFARGNARAKTGVHSDASSLSGYVTNTKGELIAFSILINHFPKNFEQIRRAQDRIVEILTNCK